jgi:hypothetical protein
MGISPALNNYKPTENGCLKKGHVGKEEMEMKTQVLLISLPIGKKKIGS